MAAILEMPESIKDIKRKTGWQGKSYSPLVFLVIGDGKTIWKSRSLQANGDSDTCNINVTGVRSLKLQVDVDGPIGFATAAWIEPCLFSSDTSLGQRTAGSQPAGDNAFVASGHPRLPIPDAAAQKESLAVIKDVYKADYDKAKTTPQKLELARKLLQQGEQTEGDPVGKFVLLRIARDSAAQAGDVSVTIQAIDKIVATYEVDPLEMKVEVLTKMSKSASTAQAQKDLVGEIEHVTDAAVDIDNHHIAQQVAGLAITVSRNAKDGALLKRSVARSKEIEQNAAAFAEAQKAQKVLDERPADPDANLVVGKFRCFNRGEWDKGLPLLALSSDATLKALAEKEITMPTEAQDQVVLGDGWWAAADSESTVVGSLVQRRAVHWYMQALPTLGGLAKAKVEKRLATVKSVLLSGTLKPSDSKASSPPSGSSRQNPARVEWNKDNPWEQFNATPGGTRLMDGFVRISKGQAGPDEVNEVRTKEGFADGIEITVVARTDKNNIRIAGPQGSKVIFNWEVNPRELRVNRPNGGGLATAVLTPLAAGKWHTLQMRVTDKGLEIRVAGRIVLSEARHYDLATKSTAAVMSYDSDIDVKSFVVTPLAGSDPASDTAPDEAQVVAVYEFRIGNRVEQLKLFSNKHIRDSDGANTWRLEGKVLVLRWPNGQRPVALGGSLHAFPDRKAFEGRNQNGVVSSGKLLSGTLTPADSKDSSPPSVSSRQNPARIEWNKDSLTLIEQGAGYGRMIRVKDGHILCCFDKGGRIWVKTSIDDGKSWTSESVLVAKSDFGIVTNPELLELRNGSLLCCFNERPNDGIHPFAIMFCSSKDGGRKWSIARRSTKPIRSSTMVAREPAAVQLPDGELQLMFANESPYRASNEQEITMLRSSDNGRTWQNPTTVSFRRGHRDGMPVPLLLRDGPKGIAVVIEDNGLDGDFKPVIVYSSLKDNWRAGPIFGDSPHRWPALSVPLQSNIYARAPYLRQMSSGETACRSNARKPDGGKPQMVVYFGEQLVSQFLSVGSIRSRCGNFLPVEFTLRKVKRYDNRRVRHDY